MTKYDKWDVRFMRVALNEVATWSKDPNTKVGCVVVSPDRRLWTTGYNGFPRGVEDTEERLNDRELKNELMMHAELNAILNSRRDLSGWTLYVTKATCKDCAPAIIQAGISRVVQPFVDDRWADSQRRALCLMLEAGITTTEMSFDEELFGGILKKELAERNKRILELEEEDLLEGYLTIECENVLESISNLSSDFKVLCHSTDCGNLSTEEFAEHLQRIVEEVLVLDRSSKAIR